MQDYLVRYSKRFFIGLLVCLLVAVVCLAMGLLIGYSISSDNNIFNIFSPDVWQHIANFAKL